jgi:hypothetical protein
MSLFCVSFKTFMEIRTEAIHVFFDWLMVHWKKDPLIYSYVGLNLVLKWKDVMFSTIMVLHSC